MKRALGSLAIVYGFISAAEHGWASIGTIPSFVAAAVLFLSFLRIEARIANPLLELNLMPHRAHLSGLAVMAIVGGMHFSMVIVSGIWVRFRADSDRGLRPVKRHNLTRHGFPMRGHGSCA